MVRRRHLLLLLLAGLLELLDFLQRRGHRLHRATGGHQDEIDIEGRSRRDRDLVGELRLFTERRLVLIAQRTQRLEQLRGGRSRG